MSQPSHMNKTPSGAGAAKQKIVIERTYKATLAEMWAMWTTKAGIESWWGPDGFAVTVEKLDLREGGDLHYTMHAVGAEQIEFMKNAGMPVAHSVRCVWGEVTPPRKAVMRNVMDFIPGVEPYKADAVVELSPVAGGVKMVITLDALHDEHWTNMAKMGWESQLGKMAKRFAEMAA